MKKPKIVAILQARMGATRLPGKPLMTVLGRSLLSYEIERLRRTPSIDQVVVATTTAPQDQAIVDLCEREGIATFRGSENDVLDRYYQAAKAFHADVVVRVTGDCPVIDPHEAELVIRHYLDHIPAYDYVSNTIQRTYPRGLDTEVFSFANLERAATEANKPSEREHVTLYFYTNPELFKLSNIAHEPNLSSQRWTVDTLEDLELIKLIIGTLYPVKPTFNMQDILGLLQQHPEWVAINAHIEQKKV